MLIHSVVGVGKSRNPLNLTYVMGFVFIKIYQIFKCFFGIYSWAQIISFGGVEGVEVFLSVGRFGKILISLWPAKVIYYFSMYCKYHQQQK